uniref:Uncharacterized protein n=1 Tax=Avena sativa TaxID=4498 RepID=A0ACD5ZLU7_AVESA
MEATAGTKLGSGKKGDPKLGVPAAAVLGASAPASSNPEEKIDDLFSHLELNEDELDDVVIGVDDAREYQQAARWLAIGKVHTTRSFSADAFFEKMKVIWNLSREPTFREAGENLFIFQMYCLGDWKKVVHQGPWTFRGWGVLIEDYDGLCDPESVVFSGLHVWAQIHGVPELYRKQEVLDELARRIGIVREVQMAPKLFFEGNYVRVRARIEISRPLMRFVSLTLPEGKRRLAVKYEKIPFLCKRCGLLGHDHEECGDGVWTEQQLQYGSWMLATRRANQPAPAPRRFTPRAPMRGGFGGSNPQFNGGPRKWSSEDAELEGDEELKDTASSPVKPGDPTLLVGGETRNDSDARKQLVMIEEGSKTPMETELFCGDDQIPPSTHVCQVKGQC